MVKRVRSLAAVDVSVASCSACWKCWSSRRSCRFWQASWYVWQGVSLKDSSRWSWWDQEQGSEASLKTHSLLWGLPVYMRESMSLWWTWCPFFHDSLSSSLPLSVSLVPDVITWNFVVEERLGETVLLANLKKGRLVLAEFYALK